jgi:hypothetical protein
MFFETDLLPSDPNDIEGIKKLSLNGSIANEAASPRISLRNIHFSSSPSIRIS